MLPVDGPVPDGPGWIAQPKMDGWRAVVDASAGRPARIWSRHGTDLTGRFVALARQLDDLDVVLDGELVVFGRDGLPRFSQLSARRPAGTVRLVAFDLLAVAGRPLHDVALEGRLEALEDLPLPDAVQVAAAGPPRTGRSPSWACCRWSMTTVAVLARSWSPDLTDGRADGWSSVSARSPRSWLRSLPASPWTGP